MDKKSTTGAPDAPDRQLPSPITGKDKLSRSHDIQEWVFFYKDISTYRLYLWFSYKLQRCEDKQQLTFRCTKRELLGLLGLEGTYKYTKLEDAIDRMMGMRFRSYDNGRYTVTNVFAQCTYFKKRVPNSLPVRPQKSRNLGTNEVEVTFTEPAATRIREYVPPYTQHFLSVLFNLNTIHALRLYELISVNTYQLSKMKEYEFYISLRQLKLQLGLYDQDAPLLETVFKRNQCVITDELLENLIATGVIEKDVFQKFSDFNRRIIVPAVNEINAGTDLLVTVEPVYGRGRGRAIKDVRLRFRRNPTWKSPDHVDEGVMAQAMELLKHEELPEESIKGILQDAGGDIARLRKAVIFLEDFRTRNKVKNPAGLIRSTLQGNWDTKVPDGFDGTDERFKEKMEQLYTEYINNLLTGK